MFFREYNSPVIDPLLNVASGGIPGVSIVNKFGRAPNGVQTTATDIWGRADATPTQQIWLAPTAARIHAIVSSSASDDGNPVGVGARTIRIWGLTSWSVAEVSEDITLDGTTPVNTANSYVMINRMKVLTSGATSINVGTITATAATDSTITAVILPGRGQTEQAIYGLPSTQSAYMINYHLSMNDPTAASRVDISLLVNENPNVQTTNYLVKHSGHLSNQGSSAIDIPLQCAKYSGPAIIKLQGTGNAADLDVSASFDLYLKNN